MIAEKIKQLIADAAKEIGIEMPVISLEHPDILAHGDYSSNIALMVAKDVGKAPKVIAEDLQKQIALNLGEEIERVEVAGAGFLNFYLSRKFFADSIKDISSSEHFGIGDALAGKKVMFEYTDPNPFKPFHIGHLMSNAIGESLSRIGEFQGANVIRANYQGDVGLHVAKAIYGMQKTMGESMLAKFESASAPDVANWIGGCYVKGAAAYEDDPNAKPEIDSINKKIYDKSDEEINKIYDLGRKMTLAAFEEVYKKLGTKFDDYFFESDMAKEGEQIVRANMGEVFEESEGAIVFHAEKFDSTLHTRVFITSLGLPAYETKELGLAKVKFAEENPDISITITASEQKDYMRVVTEALKQIDANIASRMAHITHGMMRFAEGKMSSRKGNVITGESMIEDVKDVAIVKINKEGIGEGEKAKIAEAVSIAAIKYSILRQSPGKDIIFDKEKALSFEGDSGPYLQYAYVRSLSLLEKAKSENISANTKSGMEETFEIEKMLYRFQEITSRAWSEKAPQLLVEYLTHLASAFNGFYASGMIVSDAPDSPYKIAITKSFNTVMQNGLHLLAIPLLQKM